jgi:hypothetical protein
MKITWKNASVIMTILGVITGYVVRFEVLATDVSKNKNDVFSIKTSVLTLLDIACDEAIDNARTLKKKEIAKQRCKRRKE